MGIQAENEALFWVARESTGSLRDAYTLFDQVVSFSDGNLRIEVIREKLGLVGMDSLNDLATAAANGAATSALTLLDRLLDAGVTIEQCCIDLAGYYRSLLLLKAGITRESLLGSPPERFPKAVLDNLDAPRLEEALRVLLDLYRALRYSVSPRFELEGAVMRLCALRDWVPPAELARALSAMKRALGLDNISTPPPPAAMPSTAQSMPQSHQSPQSAPRGTSPYAPHPTPYIPPSPYPRAVEAPSLVAGFDQMIAAKHAQITTPQPPHQVLPATPYPAPPAPAAPVVAEANPMPPALANVCRVFEGTVVQGWKP
jgi:DNA polymerase-3 subunit gamma/tau